MSKVVFFGLFGHGHINPTIGVVKELIHRGEEVVYFSTAEFQSKILSMGADFREYPFATSDSGNTIIGLDETLSAQAGNIKTGDMIPLNQLGEQIFSQMNIYFQVMNNPNWDLKQEIAAINPGYIIHDSHALWGKVLAKQLQIPAIASVTTFAYSEKIFEQYPEFVIQKILDLPDRYLANPQITRKMVQRLSKLVGSLTNIADYDWTDRKYCRESLNIVFTSQEFQWFGETFDAGFKFVGPSLYPRNDSGEFPFDELTGAKLIYITFGSMLSNDPAYLNFYHQCFNALGDCGQQVVMVIGNNNPQELGDIPSNFILRNSVPQIEIIKRAGLVITHGGMNSVNEALYHNVPLIIIPQIRDQFLVAERVAELGAGIYLKDNPFSARQLSDAVAQIFQNESYRNHSRIIGETLRTAGGYQRAADEIYQFKRVNGIK